MSHPPPNGAKDSILLSMSTETDNTKIVLCDSLELGSCRAEVCRMKRKLTECEAAVQRLKQRVSTMEDKHREILAKLTLSEIGPLNSPISTSASPSVQDGTLEFEDSLSDSDSDDWDSLSLSSWVYTPFVSPLSTSRRRNGGLDRIEEEDEEDSPPLPPVSQI